MKKAFTVLVLLLITIGSYGQIKKIEVGKSTLIGKIAPLGFLVVSLEKTESNNYLFYYRDIGAAPLDIYKSFTFKETGNDLENLYNMIIEGFDSDSKEPIVIAIPDGTLTISYTKSLGVKSVFIGAETSREPFGLCRGLTKRDVNKLFGKKQ